MADEIRRVSVLGEGDHLEIGLVEGVLLLKPASSSDETRRHLDEAIGPARYVGPEFRPDPEEEEARVNEQLAAPAPVIRIPGEPFTPEALVR